MHHCELTTTMTANMCLADKTHPTTKKNSCPHVFVLCKLCEFNNSFNVVN